ncbi:hypothetical protein AVEN_254300-1 [Araneus ventricosus]|uniref:Uncharacterized protein n=1 Tax=Araneus ventricosus TaxID=182803 RepID=A0A4Y2FA70_ARAVE|nr:hypothetical protein AVEN_254300-1 [Araneus ventricosus]
MYRRGCLRLDIHELLSTSKPVVNAKKTTRIGGEGWISNRSGYPFGLPGHKSTPAAVGTCVCAGTRLEVHGSPRKAGVGMTGIALRGAVVNDRLKMRLHTCEWFCK